MAPSATVARVAVAAAVYASWLSIMITACAGGSSDDQGGEATGCNFLTWRKSPLWSPDGGCFWNELKEDGVRSYSATCDEDGAGLTLWEHQSLDCSGAATDVTQTDTRLGEAFECGAEFCRVVHVVEDPRTADDEECAPDARGWHESRYRIGTCIDLTEYFEGRPASAIIHRCDDMGRRMVADLHLDTPACDAAEPVDAMTWSDQHEADCYLTCNEEAPHNAASSDGDGDASSP